MTTTPRDHLTTAALCLAASAWLSPVHAQELILNGGFEDPPVPVGVSFIDNADIPHWSPTTVDVLAAGGITGPQVVDLVGSPGLGTISQSVPTVPGATYTLRFHLRAESPAGTDIPDAVRVS